MLRHVKPTRPGQHQQHQRTHPGQHQQHQRRPVFLLTSKKPLTQKARNLAQNKPLWQRGFVQLQLGDSRKNPPILTTPALHPPRQPPSSLCEVMNEAPSRRAFVTCRRRGDLSCSGFLMSSWDGFTALRYQLSTTCNLSGDQTLRLAITHMNHSCNRKLTNPAAHIAPRNLSAGTLSWLHHTELRWPELYDEPSGPCKFRARASIARHNATFVLPGADSGVVTHTHTDIHTLDITHTHTHTHCLKGWSHSWLVLVTRMLLVCFAKYLAACL